MLPAHTNEVGSHDQWEYDKFWINGTRWNWGQGRHDPYVYEEWFARRQARSVKPAPVKGDRKSVYPYSRKVYKVMKDDPAIMRQFNFNTALGEMEYDYQWTAHISRDHGPFGYNPIRGALWENAKQESIVKCLNNLAEHKASILANLAQARQTVDLFAVNAKRGMDFLRFLKGAKREALERLLRSGSARSLRDNSRRAADLWIEFQYGWKPLAGDLFETQAAVHEKLKLGTTIRAKGKGKYLFEEEFPYRNEEWYATSNGDWVTRINAKVANPDAHLLDALGLINPATVAWELVPWSFAIDWFMPVGNTLEACGARIGLTFLKGWHSAKHNYMLNASRKVREESYTLHCVNGGNYVERGFEFWREPLGDFPVPQFYADLTPFSTLRSLNALALFRQQFGHGGSPRRPRT